MKETENLIFFQGNTQYENTGDILINRSLIALLKEHGKVIINDSGMPAWYSNSLGLEADERISHYDTTFTRHLIKSALNAKNRNQKIFLIAGPPGHQFGNSGRKSLRNVLSGTLFAVLKALGTTIIKIGFSIGPIGNYIKITEKFRSRFTQHYYVRDSLSLKLVKEIGIAHARFFPDLAWLYPVERPLKERKKVLLSFRHSVTDGQVADDRYSRLLVENIESMLKSYDEQTEIIVAYQVARDEEFCRFLFNRLKAKWNVSFLEEQITMDSAEAAYANVQCVLTNRLHVALLAYKYGALPLVLTDAKDHLKIKGIYRDAGIEQLILDIQNNTAENDATFQRIIRDRNLLMGQLDEKNREYSELAGKILKEIFEN